MTKEEAEILHSLLKENKPFWKHMDTYLLALVFTGVYWLTTRPAWYLVVLGFIMWVMFIFLLRMLGGWIEKRSLRQDLTNKKVMEVSGPLEVDEHADSRYRVLDIVIKKDLTQVDMQSLKELGVGTLVTVDVAPLSGFAFDIKRFEKPKK